MNVIRTHISTSFDQPVAGVFAQGEKADLIQLGLFNFSYMLPFNQSLCVKEWAKLILNGCTDQRAKAVAEALHELAVDNQKRWAKAPQSTKDKAKEIAKIMQTGDIQGAQKVFDAFCKEKKVVRWEQASIVDLINCYRMLGDKPEPVGI